MTGTSSTPISGDPFWSVVRQRHRDVDLAIVDAPEPPRAAASTAVPARSAEEIDRDVQALWEALLPGVPAQAQHRWVGDGRDEQRESTVTATTGIGSEALASAAATLRANGWQVLLPPAGLPRVLADREGATLALVQVSPGRTVLRMRTPAS
ncbi:hypothetical protein IM660_04985 [Ruania alkalisoli]|uniref:Uncharacterized protein n=1 Tax=Ruania alkalisoli TaxID=2779775 RepID=A0A7M1SXF9_9MICO|nr:hypothetical protein [Ruania alkalisoli]QOR71644.1 hypothetical protein IM660_04985 [Ruania alkalisoli]